MIEDYLWGDIGAPLMMGARLVRFFRGLIKLFSHDFVNDLTDCIKICQAMGAFDLYECRYGFPIGFGK